MLIVPPLAVNVESSGAAVAASTQAPTNLSRSSKKKRRSKDGEKLSSKKSKRENSPRPLPGGLLDPSFGLSDWVDFRMSSTKLTVVEHLSEREVIKASLEFTTRDAMLMWYLENFANCCGPEEVQKELAAEKKAAEETKANLEALSLEHSKCEAAQAGLLKKLKGTCIEVATLTQKLKDLHVKCDEGANEINRLKLDLQQVGKKAKEQEGE